MGNKLILTGGTIVDKENGSNKVTEYTFEHNSDDFLIMTAKRDLPNLNQKRFQHCSFIVKERFLLVFFGYFDKNKPS